MLTSVASDIAIQIRVIGALIFRELHTRYGRENIGFLWVIGEPAIFCVGVAIMWTAIRPAHEHGIPMTAFVITGYVPLTMWRHCVSRGVKAFEANGSLLFHRQVTPLDIILARVVLEVYGSVIAGLLVSCAAMIIGVMDPPWDYGILYLGLATQIVFCLNSALLIAALSERSEILEKVIGAFTYLSIPFSGAFIMADWLPARFQEILLWSPMANSSEMIRAGVFGPSVRAIYDVTYTVWMNAVLLVIGLSFTLRSRKFILVQ